ncbi:MAG: HAMP domain-containing histidine kinase [Syntrophobacteraceae bacterium]|nr:HAMP domain-containing histidine kinase [Syntrophobacteraceae bacterium]
MSHTAHEKVFERVREKKESYRRYNFEKLQEEAFATFFDLAQENTSIETLYLISVAVPREFFGLQSRLYVIHPRSFQLEKVCTSEDGLVPEEKRLDFEVPATDIPLETEDSWIFPIRGNQALAQWTPILGQSQTIGMFEIHPKEKVDAKGHFFLEKFTNRIGYNLHMKLLIQQHFDHIKFINQLVADIEHNVISPNLYYKLFLIKLKKLLASYQHVQQEMDDVMLFLRNQNEALSNHLCEIQRPLADSNASLEQEYKALKKHYEHTSLFLETLLRRDHFEKGTYVLRKQPCNFRTEIMEPLLERHRPQFEKRKIKIDSHFESVPDEQITLFVDKGLISQVFDNFLTNAIKYTQQVEDQLGHRIKLFSYSREILKDHFGEGIHGIRFNFFSTGKPLSLEDSRMVFEEGYRAMGSAHERGSGHGLHFVSNVVEIHGGKVGCEPQRFGNLFYFVIPMKEERPQQH